MAQLASLFNPHQNFISAIFKREMDEKPEKHRGSYRTHRRSVAKKKSMKELRELRELLKRGPQQVVPTHPNALITGYPDPQQVPPSVAALVERATRDLEERNRQLRSHISQLKAEAKEQAKIIELLSKKTVRLQKEREKEASKASTTGPN